ncbi:ABC transporter permease [Clostridioides sp. ZZV15-6597]|uniref:ABC transporter permease n=1 Tax=Clostridioides sp. ZZV15-6597 TaxID=2811500 RepID=UPI001D119A92|nr:ABC transporter permease [Clostridioides sp. ZZV15-6597]
MNLFIKECKNILKSTVYYVFIVVLVVFYISQLGSSVSEDASKNIPNDGNPLVAPQRVENIDEYYLKNNQYPYGQKESLKSDKVIPSATISLIREYQANSYTTYPMGIIKYIKLNESKTQTIEKYIEEITGNSIDKVNSIWKSGENIEVNTSKLSFERFQEIMRSVDEILGGGSAYSIDKLERFGMIPVTYEEAMQDYSYTIQKDKVTNGYARIFCDYIGIILSIFPVFVAVFMSMKDRRSRMSEIVYSKQASTSKIILSRYFALVFMMMLPVLILGIKELLPLISFAKDEGISIDNLAFVKYTLWWLLPTLMIVTAVGVSLTVLTDTPVAIIVQLIWWFYSINSIGLEGDYPSMGLMIRHNNVLNGTIISENFNTIMSNRLLMGLGALIIVLLTTFLYEQKRRGNLNVGSKFSKLFSFNKRKLQIKHSN